MHFELFFLILKHIFIFIILFLSLCGLGKTLLKCLNRIDFSSSFEEIFFSAATGMLVSITVIIVLSLFSILYKPLVFLLIFWGITGIKNIKISAKDYFWFVLIFIMLFPIFCLTMYPPSSWDDISYHLPHAQSILLNHKLVLNELLCRYPLFPLNAEVLFSMGLSLGSLSVQLFPFIFMYTITIGCFSEIIKKFNNYSGLVVVGLLVSNPLMAYLASTCYIDLLIALFVTSSLIALCNWFESKNKSWFYLSALLLGFAVGTKYSALLFCIIAATILIYRKKYKLLLQYLAIIFISGSFWYLRNFYYTGNPFWPALGSIFGFGNLWTHSDYITQARDLAFQSYGKNIINIFFIPLLLAKSQEVFGLNLIIWPGVISTLFFIAKKKRHLILLYSLLAYTVLWFISFAITRYYVPIVPVLCIISSLGLISAIKKLFPVIISKIIFLSIILYSLLILNNYMLFKMNSFNTLPPSNNTQQENFLAEYIPEYKAGKVALKLKGKTYGLCTEKLIFWSNGRVIGDWYGKTSWYTVLDILDKPDKLYSHLRKLGVKNLLINKKRVIFEEKPNNINIVFPNTTITPDYINNIYNYEYTNNFDRFRLKLGEKSKPRIITFKNKKYTFDYINGLFYYYKKIHLNRNFIKVYEDKNSILYKLK